MGSSQAGTQQSSQGGRPSHSQRHAQSQGCSNPRYVPNPRHALHLSPSPKGGLKPQHTLRVTGKQLPPSSSSSVAQQATTQGDGHQETAMDTSEACPWDGETLADKWGEPCSFDDEGPDMPKSEGWKANYATFFQYYLRGHYPHIPLAQLRVIYEPVFKYLGTCWKFWAMLKEEDPLQLMPYLASAFERKTTLTLPTLANYKKWIKSGSFYHAVILRREELNHIPHLAFAQVPNMNQRSPNEDALISHRHEYKAALQQADVSLAALAKAQMNLLTSLVICRKDTREVKALSLPEPLQVWQPWSGAEDATVGATSVPATSKRQKRQATGEADHPGHSLNPFPLQADGDWRAIVQVLLNTVAGITHATSEDVARYFQTKYPRISPADARRGANQLLVTISEYQLMCALHDPSGVSPMIPSQIEQELHPEEEYYKQLPPGTPVDFRQVEWGHTLRFGAFIHRIDQTVTWGVGTSQSVREDEHSAGPLLQLLLGPETCPLTTEVVITQVIAENVETLHWIRRGTLPKAQQYHIELMSLLQSVAVLESHCNCEQDPAECKCMKRELDTLRVKRDKAQHRRDRQQQITERCEEYLVLVGELECTAASGGTTSDAQTSTASEETAEAPIEASGSTQEMLPLEEDMEVGNVDSPVRATADELLDEPSDQEDSQTQEAGDMPRETSEEADPDTPPTGSKTPSTGVTAGLSELSVSSPRAQPTPELMEGPTTSTPQGPASDTAPPTAEQEE